MQPSALRTYLNCSGTCLRAFIRKKEAKKLQPLPSIMINDFISSYYLQARVAISNEVKLSLLTNNAFL